MMMSPFSVPNTRHATLSFSIEFKLSVVIHVITEVFCMGKSKCCLIKLAYFSGGRDNKFCDCAVNDENGTSFSFSMILIKASSSLRRSDNCKHCLVRELPTFQ